MKPTTRLGAVCYRLLLGVGSIALVTASSSAQEEAGGFVPIEVPGATFTACRAIAADGRIVGFYGDASGRQHGFLLAHGVFTTIDAPAELQARGTSAFGINNRGDIVGSWIDRDGVQRGFLLPADGAFTVIDGPAGAIRALARGITAAGDIVGYFDTPDKRHGFLLSRHGQFSPIDIDGTLGPPPNGTFAQWMNARGDVVGSFFDGSVHGFLLSGDRMTQLDVDVPGATNTNAPGLNDRGDIVGFYTVGGRQVSFRRDRHGNYESFEAPTPTPASSTLAIGINASGDIVGQYTYQGVTRGFVRYADARR